MSIEQQSCVEAMKQALEALETTQTLMRLSDPQYVREYNAITSLRQAIAEAEKQEPVAWRPALTYEGYAEQGPWNTGKPSGNDIVYWDNEGGVGIEYAYTHPPKREWVGLTDEEMHECWDSPLTPLGMKHVRMIEAKLKAKNFA